MRPPEASGRRAAPTASTKATAQEGLIWAGRLCLRARKRRAKSATKCPNLRPAMTSIAVNASWGCFCKCSQQHDLRQISCAHPKSSASANSATLACRRPKRPGMARPTMHWQCWAIRPGRQVLPGTSPASAVAPSRLRPTNRDPRPKTAPTRGPQLPDRLPDRAAGSAGGHGE